MTTHSSGYNTISQDRDIQSHSLNVRHSRRPWLSCILLGALVAGSAGSASAQCEQAFPESGSQSAFGQSLDLDDGVAAAYSDKSGGLVRIYRLDPQTDTWGLETTIARSAHKVAIDGDWLAVSDHNGSLPGQVYMYRYTGTWNLYATITAQGGVNSDSFGTSITLDSGYLCVGASGKKNAQGITRGAVYVYLFNGIAWQLDGIAQNQNTGISQGLTCAIATDGLFPRLASGDFSDERVHMFVRGIGGWVLQSTIRPSDFGSCGGGSFGRSIWMDDDELLVGAPNDFCEIPPVGTGAIYTYQRNGTSWVETQKIDPNDTVSFGWSVDRYEDRVVVGDPSFAVTIGMAAFYTVTPNGLVPDHREFGTAVALVAGNAPSFGESVSIHGKRTLISAPAWIPVAGQEWAGLIRFGYDYEPSSWQNYGNGWAGTNGIPSLGLDVNPLLGTTPQLMVGNSRGIQTSGTLVQGLAPAQLMTGVGGTLLVSPQTFTPISIDAGGEVIPLPIDCDLALSGLSVYFQVIQEDPGASANFSFTRGLQITLGSS